MPKTWEQIPAAQKKNLEREGINQTHTALAITFAEIIGCLIVFVSGGILSRVGGKLISFHLDRGCSFCLCSDYQSSEGATS